MVKTDLIEELENKGNMATIEQAIILAAGEGQRLRPLTSSRPKVMIPIANKPILQYAIESLASGGIRNIVIVVGYNKEQVIDYFGSGKNFNVEIQYITQAQQLGTAHALQQVKDIVQDKFLVMSGDNILEYDVIASLINASPNTIVAKKQDNASQYGVIITGGGLISRIIEKPKEAISQLVNTGIYLFNKDVFKYIEHETEIPSVIHNMITRGCEIRVHETRGTWLDAVYPWDILKLNSIAASRVLHEVKGVVEDGVTIKPPVYIGKNSAIRGNSYIVGPVIIGDNCQIGPNVCILPATTIGDNACIYPFTEIKNCVIGSSVELGPFSFIHDSIIDRYCVTGGHFIAHSRNTEIKIENEYHQVEMGAILGEHSVIEDNVIVQPGIIVGTNTRVGSLKLIDKNIPDGSLVI